ncbi:hypothetical protein EBR57_06535 [bacterium]|nr:hypothetical protein [bacterium]
MLQANKILTTSNLIDEEPLLLAKRAAFEIVRNSQYSLGELCSEGSDILVTSRDECNLGIVDKKLSR